MALESAIPWVIAFLGGVAVVWALDRRRDRSVNGSPAYGRGSSNRVVLPTVPRPSAQLAIKSFDELVQATSTSHLLQTIEQRSRLSKGAFESDCRPLLRGFAEYVQMLPASESHHHAQPGGLWIHVLEVVDAALAYRNGMELPRGAPTEDRKRLEHRYTYGVLLAALLHDVGKPFADMRVTLYGEDPRIGRSWAAIAGPMNDATHYSVAFTPPSERDYGLHQRLPAMLMQKLVPEKTLKWLSDDPPLLSELIRYLSGEKDPGSAIADIVRRADAESVKRNLLSGPRTRFASARATPLIERLMEALRRMLKQGGVLPLNKPGAAGWVYDGSIWFVCARLADDLRDYMSKHESAEGIPGPDLNDRIFDEFQDYGACVSNPEGTGAIWKVIVELENWRSPRELTVMRFELSKLYRSPDEYPSPIVGRVAVLGSAGKSDPTQITTPAAPAQQPAATSAAPAVVTPTAAPVQPLKVPQPATPAPRPHQPISTVSEAAPAKNPSGGEALAAPTSPALIAPALSACPSSSEMTAARDPISPDAVVPQPCSPAAVCLPPDGEVPHTTAQPSTTSLGATSQASCPAAAEINNNDLDASDRATHSSATGAPLISDHIAPFVVTTTTDIDAPQRPYERPKKGPRPAKDATPATNAFLSWVQSSVATGHLKYNEPGSMVHFVPDGMLLFSPEIFRRFLSAHSEVESGPVAALIASHGDKAFQRLQNELAKSPYAVRNGDENLHYYAFNKHDGGLSAVSSYFLIGQPSLFFNPVPPPNSRIVKATRPARKLRPVGASPKQEG